LPCQVPHWSPGVCRCALRNTQTERQLTTPAKLPASAAAVNFTSESSATTRKNRPSSVSPPCAVIIARSAPLEPTGSDVAVDTTIMCCASVSTTSSATMFRGSKEFAEPSRGIHASLRPSPVKPVRRVDSSQVSDGAGRINGSGRPLWAVTSPNDRRSRTRTDRSSRKRWGCVCTTCSSIRRC
jgi:hypothetical protein